MKANLNIEASETPVQLGTWDVSFGNDLEQRTPRRPVSVLPTNGLHTRHPLPTTCKHRAALSASSPSHTRTTTHNSLYCGSRRICIHTGATRTGGCTRHHTRTSCRCHRHVSGAAHTGEGSNQR